jgi:hypothetical protein
LQQARLVGGATTDTPRKSDCFGPSWSKPASVLASKPSRAFAPTEEAFRLYQEQAATNPAFLPDLAGALNNLEGLQDWGWESTPEAF